MKRAAGDSEALGDDLVSCLSKAVAATGRPPKIATLSAAPVANLMTHVFGEGATLMLIGGSVSPLSIDPATFAVIPRFVDAETFNRLRAADRPWLMSAAAIILQFQPGPRQIDDLVSGGFTRTRQFTAGGRRTTVFLPEEVVLRPARDDASNAGRPAPARLVIVDPCLGRAAGHYEAYARMLTEGARDLGLDVAWACHAGRPGPAPAGVDLRRCFERCFFDLGENQVGTVDLSPELFEGWQSILAEFDRDDTHILMHSADAHQVRAVAAVFQRRPPSRATVHINFQTSPRFMPGRLAGGDVHAAVWRLRRAPAWERSLFFWAETRRLASWLSEWLAEEISAPPFLSAWDGTARAARTGASVPITVAFLGEGRPSKGFLDLPDIADHIAAQRSLGGAVRLVVQNWPPFRGDLARHAAALERLSRRPFVEIVDGVLDAASYETLLDEADILLLPYEPQTYALQGSGILTEGLARGKIIVARAGTAIVDEARAGVGFAYETPADLAVGLVEIVDNYRDLAATAVGRAEQFRQDNTPRRFISALAARSRGILRKA